MKLLLNNRIAPLTFTWGFLDCPISNVVRAYRRWQRRILHSARVDSLDLSLAEALRKLEPLDMASSRVLFLSTKSPWTVCFDNGARGGNAATFVGHLSEILRCRGIVCRSIPNTLSKETKGKRGTWGAVQFTLYAPESRKFLHIERRLPR